MNFEKVDRTLFWEMGYWKDTLERWYGEGLPKGGGRHRRPEARGGRER